MLVLSAESQDKAQPSGRSPGFRVRANNNLQRVCIAFPHLVVQWLEDTDCLDYRCGGSAGIAWLLSQGLTQGLRLKV
jgi:hypothetical protein